MIRQLERSTIHLLAKRGKSKRQIARELGLSRITVGRALQEPVDKKSAPRQRRSVVDPYAEQIRQWLQEGLSIVRMLELARADPVQPYTAGRSVFSDYVRRIQREEEQSHADVPIRFEGLPGEYLQVDWGEVRRFPFTQRPPATRYFLACRLKYSRWSWVWWTTRMDQETLLQGLVACLCALAWVPWVLVFDNMKTVTLGRDAQDQPIWHPVFLQFAREFDFHPEACAVRAANQKGSVESLVKWVKGNFLPGRSFADDADLAEQTGHWLERANTRPNDATREPPLTRLPTEAAQGGVLPPAAHDYGFPESGRVDAESLVHVGGNVYSVPLGHVGAPVTVRLHRERVVIWRDTVRLVEHGRAPDGAHQRVILPTHFAPLFGKKPRAQTMLEREALLGLGGSAASYVTMLSRRCRDRLSAEITATYALYTQHGPEALLRVMTQADRVGVYGADYLKLLLVAPGEDPAGARVLPDLPPQSTIDRELRSYEAWVIGAGPVARSGKPRVEVVP
jgi:transposase